jgi:hypothetical protein
MAKRETLELVRAYYRIVDPAVRRRSFELSKAVAAAPAGRPAEDPAAAGVAERSARVRPDQARA